MLKPWIPNTPMHCYDFNTCEFWVQVFGLPLECFYDLDPPQEDADETVPEAPQPSSAMIPVKELVAVAPLQWQPLIEESSRTTIELDKRPVIQQHTKLNEIAAASLKSKKVNSSRLNARSGPIKKVKKLIHHDVRTQLQEGFDDSLLQETPIFKAAASDCWALVASQRKFSFSSSFIENPVGLAGGLAIFWNNRVSLNISHHSSTMLDFICTELDLGITTRLTLAVRR